METQRIFLEHIHDEAYMNQFTRTAVDAAGLITGRRPDTEFLDGVWNYSPDLYDTALRSRWFEEPLHDEEGRPLPWDFDFDRWPEMRLPATWNVRDPRLFYYEQPVVFTRAFRYESRGEERVVLRFGGVQYAVAVFLNGVAVAYHRGGSTPFTVDVTAAIRRENRIFLVVENVRRCDRVPMTNTDWFNYGGVHRSIEILRLPKTAIRTHFIRLAPGSPLATGGSPAPTDSRIACTVELTDPAATGTVAVEIPALSVVTEISVTNGIAATEIDARVDLWSPESPTLYDVTLRYGADVVVDRIGFRRIERSGRGLLLNGRPIFLRGISIHEESVANGRTLTEEEIVQNLTIAKELGCNFVRLAHYPHAGRTAEVADEMGILLWEEIPVYWAIDFENPATLADARNQLSELVLRDRNRASVVIWSVGNENPDTDARLRFMGDLAVRTRELDPSRLVSAACLIDHVANRIADRLAEKLDVIGVNEYLGWYDPDFSKLPDLLTNSAPDKPVVITEFGAGAEAGNHGTADEMFTEEFQERVYREQVRVIAKTPYIKGMSPWILYDFRSPRRTNRFQRGYNRKGLLAEDKGRRKKAFAVLQEFYRRLATKPA